MPHHSEITSLENAEEPATGLSLRLPLPSSKYTWSIVLAGTVSTIDIDLEGSLDGQNWFVVDSYTSITSTIRFVTDKTVCWLRAKLNAFTGVGDIFATVKIVSPGP